MDTKVEKMFYADSYPAAMVVDEAVGGPAVSPSGPNHPYYQIEPGLRQSGQLSPQKPRHLLGSHTKTLKPIVSQTASKRSPVLCLKEPIKYDTAFGVVDYVFLFRGRVTSAFDAVRLMQWSAERLSRSGRTVFRFGGFAGRVRFAAAKRGLSFVEAWVLDLVTKSYVRFSRQSGH